MSPLVAHQKLLSMSICMSFLVFSVPSPVEHQICPAVCVLMKLSFDEEHRHAMNELGELLKRAADRFFAGDEVLMLSRFLLGNSPHRWAAGGGRASAGGL